MTAVAYGDVVFGGRTFLAIGGVAAAYGRPPFSSGYTAPNPGRAEIDPGAEAWQVVPWSYAEQRAVQEVTLPLWNEFAAFGVPLLSNGQTPLFNPVTALTLLSPRTTWLWDLQFLVWRFLAGYFCALFLIELGALGPFVWMGAIFGVLFPCFTIFVSRADQGAFALIPMLLYCLLRLRKSPGPQSAGFLALAFAFCLAAGHPEPSAAALLVSGTAALGLLAFPTEARGLAALSWMAIAGIVGLFLATPTWLPFVIGLSQKLNQHPAGLGLMTRPPFAALQLLVPAAFSLTRMRALFDLPLESFGFLGGVAGVLFLAAALRLLAVRDFARYAWALGGLLLLLKNYGAPLVGNLSRLPLLSQMLPFYLIPGTLFCLGLAGFLAASDLARSDRRTRLISLGGALALALAAILLARYYVPDHHPGGLSESWKKQRLLYVVLIVGTIGFVVWWHEARGRLQQVIALLLLLAGGAELFLFRAKLPVAGEMFAVPPYVKFLEQKEATEGPFYVTGLGPDLYPNSATAWALDDIRMCDALFMPRYVTALAGVTRTAFNGTLIFDNPPPVRDLPPHALDFLGVRYLVGDARFFANPEPLVPALLAANAKLSAAEWNIEGSLRSIVFQHPDNVAEVRFTIPSDRPQLSFAIAQEPGVWTKPGGAVTYSLEMDAGEGFSRIYQRTLNTRTNLDDRHWRIDTIDLRKVAGREVTLRFSASAQDLTYAWGGWGGLAFTSGGDPSAASSCLPQVWHDAEMGPAAVYANATAWDRSYLMGAPELVPNAAAALAKVLELLPAGQRFSVVEPDFPRDRWQQLCASGSCLSGVAGRAQHIQHRSNTVTFEVDADRPAVVVLAETFAQGWTATVDGVDAEVFHANYLFRGVMVDKGHHQISMRYWPREWTWALFVCGLASLVITGLFVAGSVFGPRAHV